MVDQPRNLIGLQADSAPVNLRFGAEQVPRHGRIALGQLAANFLAGDIGEDQYLLVPRWAGATKTKHCRMADVNYLLRPVGMKRRLRDTSLKQVTVSAKHIRLR